MNFCPVCLGLFPLPFGLGAILEGVVKKLPKRTFLSHKTITITMTEIQTHSPVRLLFVFDYVPPEVINKLTLKRASNKRNCLQQVSEASLVLHKK